MGTIQCHTHKCNLLAHTHVTFRANALLQSYLCIQRHHLKYISEKPLHLKIKVTCGHANKSHLKEHFTPKCKFGQSPHPCWWIVSQVSQSSKHFWSFTAQQHRSFLLINLSSSGVILKQKNNRKTWNGAVQLVNVVQVSRSPEIPNWYEKTLLTPWTCFWPLRMGCVLYLDIHREDLVFKKPVDKVFSNQFGGTWGSLRLGLRQNFSQLFVFSVLKPVPSYFGCLGERCFIVKLQKYLSTTKLSISMSAATFFFLFIYFFYVFRAHTHTQNHAAHAVPPHNALAHCDPLRWANAIWNAIVVLCCFCVKSEWLPLFPLCPMKCSLLVCFFVMTYYLQICPIVTNTYSIYHFIFIYFKAHGGTNKWIKMKSHTHLLLLCSLSLFVLLSHWSR